MASTSLHAGPTRSPPILGISAFSLAERTKMSEDGFEFASHLDGKR